MQTIFKYKLNCDHTARNVIELPVGAVVLTCQYQNDGVYMWVAQETDNEKETRIFNVFGTGLESKFNHGLYIATVQEGGYVWHIFENKDRRQQERND